MTARWIVKLGEFYFDIKHKAGKKVPYAHMLTVCYAKDDEQTALVNAIVTDAEQDNTV